MRPVFNRESWLVVALLAAPLGGCLTGGSSPDERGRAADAGELSRRTAGVLQDLSDQSGRRARGRPGRAGAAHGRRAKRYVACVRYNARESDGRFRGVQEQAVLFVDGRLDRVLEEIDDTCAGAAYAPFPELEKLTR